MYGTFDKNNSILGGALASTSKIIIPKTENKQDTAYAEDETFEDLQSDEEEIIIKKPKRNVEGRLPGIKLLRQLHKSNVSKKHSARSRKNNIKSDRALKDIHSRMKKLRFEN